MFVVYFVVTVGASVCVWTLHEFISEIRARGKQFGAVDLYHPDFRYEVNVLSLVNS